MFKSLNETVAIGFFFKMKIIKKCNNYDYFFYHIDQQYLPKIKGKNY